MDNLKQLRLLYNEILCCVDKVSVAIDSEMYADIVEIVAHRQGILRNIESVRHSYNKPLPQDLIELTEIIKTKELNNIKKLEMQKNEVGAELDKVKHQSKFLNAYSAVEQTSGELLDYIE